LRIFIHVSFETVLRRGIERDQAWMGSAATAEHRYPPLRGCAHRAAGSTRIPQTDGNRDQAGVRGIV
jgi:hypothetical protein